MEELSPNVIYLSPGDPWNSPRGGQTAFAKQALNALGARFAIVAPSEAENVPIGEWILGDWNGAPIWRFNIGSYAPKNKSRLPLIPRRIIYRRLIRKFLPHIRKIGVGNLFLDSPELLGVVGKYEWNSVCYRFAGLSNPVEFSRYKYLRFLSQWFHQRMMGGIKHLQPDVLLASADRRTIQEFEQDNQKYLKDARLVFFPTRFDPNVFFPGDPVKEQRSLGWDAYYPRLTIVGRLCWIKGWRLALETVKILKERFPNILLVFVGDGEDRRLIEDKINELKLTDNVVIKGFLPPEQVRKCLVASDLCLSTSIKEGWSVAAVEALACGKTMVSTNVSGASDMIRRGRNGFVVTEYDPVAYSNGVLNALDLLQDDSVNHESLLIAKSFSLSSLAEDWASLWKPLR